MIRTTPIRSAREIAPLWQKMCASIPHPFFLSWPWIENLLETSPSLEHVRLLLIGGETPTAIALIFDSTAVRRGVLRLRTLGLNAHETGQVRGLTPEYVGLLVDPDSEAACWETLLDHLLTTRSEWHELLLEGASTRLVDAWTRRGQNVRESQRSPSRQTDLNRVRAAKDSNFLSLVSSRARSRIRATIRGVQQRLGPVTCELAATAAQADEYFSELKVLHDLRWKDDPSGGAFSAPGWESFHRRLIARNHQDGILSLVRVKAGDTTLGVLYYFLHQGIVYFYQCGINYEASLANESPGLLLHTTMIEHFAGKGFDRYDFMAGDAQYKRTLATDSVELWWGALQSPRLSLRAEAAALSAYRALRKKLEFTRTAESDVPDSA